MSLAILSIVVLIFSIVLHELAHGFVALKLGDPTAKYAGRLNLNPLVHLDPYGSFFLPLVTLLLTFGRGPIFGFAKPVPINPYNFRDQKWGQLKVALAGPAANFLIAVFLGLLLRSKTWPFFMVEIFSIASFYNFFWGFFNLLPVPPLDGSHILFSLLPQRFFRVELALKQYNLLILICFIVFGFNFIEPLSRNLLKLVAGY